MSVGQQPLDAQGGADLGLPVRARNRSDTDVVWEYAQAKYVIPAGGERLVPYMAMVYMQGDPRAVNKPGGRDHEQHRRKEHEALAVRYGIYEGTERQWEDIPLVECYPIDSDLRFETVLHDPEGTHLAGQTQDISELRFARDTMEQQAAALRAMQQRLALLEQQDAAAKAAGMDPADLDRQETEHRTVTPDEAGISMVSPSPQRRAPVPKGGVAERDPGPAVTRDGE